MMSWDTKFSSDYGGREEQSQGRVLGLLEKKQEPGNQVGMGEEEEGSSNPCLRKEGADTL